MRHVSVGRRGAAVALGLTILAGTTATARNLDGFARCLRARGARFYGTVWCPHCTAQRDLFGRAARFLPYVECSIDGSQQIRSECADVRGFPTWTFRDGSELSGRLSLETLAAKTGCSVGAAPRDEPLVIDVPGGGARQVPNGSGVEIIEIR